MTVTVRLFSVLRDRAGVDRIELPIDGSGTVQDVADAIYGRYPAIAAYRRYVRLALNQAYVRSDASVADGDEVALIPPVSGG